MSEEETVTVLGWDNWFESDWKSNELFVVLLIALPSAGFLLSALMYCIIRCCYRTMYRQYTVKPRVIASAVQLLARNREQRYASRQQTQQTVTTFIAPTVPATFTAVSVVPVDQLPNPEQLRQQFEWKLQMQQLLQRMALNQQLQDISVSGLPRSQIMLAQQADHVSEFRQFERTISRSLQNAETVEKLFQQFYAVVKIREKGKELPKEELEHMAIQEMYKTILKRIDIDRETDAQHLSLRQKLDAISVDYDTITAMAEQTMRDDQTLEVNASNSEPNKSQQTETRYTHDMSRC